MSSPTVLKRVSALTLCYLFAIFFTHASIAQVVLNPLDSSESEQSPESSISTDTISAKPDPELDDDIRKRLQGIFLELEHISDTNVEVSNGVVTLQGQLLSADAIDEAAHIASKIEGVVDIDNQLILQTSVTQRLDKSLSELGNESRTFLTNIPLFILSLSIIVTSWFIGRWAAKRHSWFRRITPNAFIAELVGNMMWLLVVLAGLFLALRLLDATDIIGTVLGAAGIIGLAVGFAVRDTVENYIASILLSIRNPFKTRDYVAVDGYEGSVARLTSRATILISSDGNHIRIPNAIVYKSVITNYSRNPLRRFEFEVGIDSADDILDAQHLAIDALKNVPGVLLEPQASVTVTQLGDSNTTLIIRCWMNQNEHDLVKIRSESIRLIKAAFDQAGVLMPEPIYRVIINDGNLQHSSTKTTESKLVRRPNAETNKPAQSVSAEKTTSQSIAAELATAEEENLLSDDTAHE